MLNYSKHDPRCFDKRLYKGGGSTSNQSNPNTTNTDKRIAISEGMGISGDGSSIYSSTTNSTAFTDGRSSSYADSSTTNYNSDGAIASQARTNSDAVIALSNAGADVIKSSGAAVVDLARFQGEQNTESFNSLVTAGASLVDRLIDKTEAGFALSEKVVDAYTPTQNAEQKTMQYGLIAAAVVAGALLLKGSK